MKELPQPIQSNLAHLRNFLSRGTDASLDPGDPVMNDFSEAEYEEMLSIVITDALDGVDIIKTYPSFVQKLMGSASLRQVFLDTLEIVEKSQTGELEPLPYPPDLDLFFLGTIPPLPEIELTAEGSWRVKWYETSTFLQNVFSSPGMSGQLPTRGAPSPLADPPFSLLRQELEVGDERLFAVLEAVHPPTDPGTLHLTLQVAFETIPPHSPLQAHLQWGGFSHRTSLDASGKAHFPAIPFESILDPSRAQITEPLHLTLQAGDLPD